MITYYDNFIEGDTEIEVDDATPEDAVSVLEFRDETQMQSGVILAKPTSGFTEQTYSVTEGADVVRLEGNRVIPLKGGFASVLIHAEKGLQRSAAVWEKTVRIYVDREVTSVALDIAEGTVSSLSEFTVTAEVRPADALTGKELVYKTDDVNTAEIGADGRLVFKKAGTVRVSAEVRFGGELRGSASASGYEHVRRGGKILNCCTAVNPFRRGKALRSPISVIFCALLWARFLNLPILCRARKR